MRATQLGVVLAILAAWQTAALLGDSFYLPEPLRVWHRLAGWFTAGTPYGSVWTQISTTLEEAAVGFLVGAVTGTVAGVLVARTRFLADVCTPFISVVNAMPRIVLGALFVILFGLGPSSKVATVLVMVFFAVFSEAFASVRAIEPAMIQEAYLFGARARHALALVVVPMARARILAGLDRAFGLALIGALMGEFIGADRGLGLLIHDSQATFDTPGIYAGLILTTAVGLLAKWTISAATRLLAGRPAPTGSR